MAETILIKILLFGNGSADAHTNTQILNATIDYSLTTKRFDESVSILIRKSFWLFFPLYNDTNMPVLIESKTLSGSGSFYRIIFCILLLY